VSDLALGLSVPRQGIAFRLLGWSAIAAAVVVGAVGGKYPVVVGVVALALLAAAAGAVARARPIAALNGAFFVILLAATKFRARPATASVAGEIDAQVLFELGLYAVIGLVAVMAASSQSFHRRRLTPAEILLALYSIIAVGSALWSRAPMLTLVKSTQLGILFVLCVVAVRVMEPEGLLHSISGVAIPYVLVCGCLAVVFPWAENQVSTNPGRFSWFYVHPISAASYAAVGLLAVYFWARFGKTPRQRITLLRAFMLALPLVVILLLTRARGPLIATVVAIGLVTIRTRVPRWLIAGVGAAALILLATYVNGGVSWRQWLNSHSGDTVTQFLLRGQDVEDVADFSGRTELWKGATTLFEARPFLGYGYGGARNLLLERLPWAGDAHNGMMQSLLDAGLIGSLPLWAALVWAFSMVLFRDRRRGPADYAQPAAAAFLTFALLNSTTDVGFAEPGYLFALTVVCVLAAERLSNGGARLAAA